MSTDLLDQLAQYGADQLARQAPVGQQEILARVRELAEPEHELLDEERPTRPRFVLAAAAVVLVLIAGLALIVVGRDASEPSDVPGTDLIRTTEPSLPSTSIEPSPTPSTTSPTTTSDPGAGAPVEIPSIAANALASESIAVAGTDVEELSEVSALVAWDNGFLYVSVIGGIQMAVELSDEMFSRLPIEVQEAYPEQLDGPLGQVIARLQDDGLLDEVQAALEADPELDAAVRSGPTTPIELVAEFSVDGETWTPVELAAPAEMDVVEIFVVADRLVVIGAPPQTLVATPFQTLIVASTKNLEDWSVQTIPDVVEVLDEMSIAAGAGCSSPPVPAHGYDVGASRGR